MAYWFHRNPLKATATVNFDLKMVTIAQEAIQMCSELKGCRSSLLDVLSNPNSSISEIESKSNGYLALLRGLIENEHLRFSLRFRWTDSLLGNHPTAKQDAVFELISICTDLAIWFSKHAAMLAALDEVDMERAKDVHTCLRRSAGIFIFVGDEPRAGEMQCAAGSDSDPRVLKVYVQQCTAEAQEVAIARAMELKHSHSLISTLAAQTARVYTEVEGVLSQLDPKRFGKWRTYLQAKSAFYTSLAYCYLGENFLSQEKCGEAIRALQESQKLYEGALRLCEEYAKAKGPGSSARPAEHPFFLRLGPLIRRTLDKCLRENGFIYHQRVPDETPKLESQTSYGLAEPVPFQLPERSSLWTPACASAFVGLTQPPAPDSAAAVAAEGELPPVKEAHIHQSNVHHKNESSCLIQ